MSLFVRPKNIKIWEMCKWVDENMYQVTSPGKNTKVEDQIIIYLYFIIESLARKKKFFKKTSYYEDYALDTAAGVFNTMRFKLRHSGEIKRGKEVIPIKSSLNYIKSILYPSKVEFEKKAYRMILNPETGVNTEAVCESLRADVRESYHETFEQYLNEVLQEYPKKLHEMLISNSPYRKDSVVIQKIYLSILLSLLNHLSLSNKYRKIVDNDDKKLKSDKILNLYENNKNEIILWHLPDNMLEYIRINVVKAKRLFTNEMKVSRNRNELSEELIDAIISTGFTTYDKDREDN